MNETPHQPTFKTVNQIPLVNRLLRRKDVEQKTGKSRSAMEVWKSELAYYC